jgi:hypothetical protein
MKTWNDATTAQIVETLDHIDDASCLYRLEYFPADVRELVRRDFKRIYAGATANSTIFGTDGTLPEAVNAVYGMDLALRIAEELNLSYESASGRQRTLRRIKAAFMHREFGCELTDDGELATPVGGNR